MTRRKGRRAHGSGRGRSIPPAFLASTLLHLLLAWFARAPAADFGGRVGFEVDGLEESYQSYGIFDDRVRIGGSIEDVLEQRPVRSRSTALLGLLDLHGTIGDTERKWLDLRGVGRLGRERRRADLHLEAGLRTRSDRFRFEDQFDAQGGEDDPAAGSLHSLLAAWDRRLPWRLRSSLRLGADFSKTRGDSLEQIFDYRMLRAQAELIRPILPGLDLRGMFSYRAKDAVDESAASYDSRLGELSAEGAVGSRGRIDLTVRLEDREYEHPEIGIPSSRTAGLEGRFERSIGSRLRPYVDQRWEREDYRGGDSASAFVDYWRWEGQAGTDITLGASNDPVLGIALGPDWRLRAGARGEVLRTSSPSADSLSILADYDSFGGLLGLAKEGAERFWFDATVEVGRRDYHGSASGSLVFEGLNLSLASSDFTYLRTTLLAQWAPIPWVRGEAFIQWDEEFHERSIDDFRLWILNVSLTHPF